MPTYDYECTACGHVFEAFHGINATPEINCEKCNDKKTEKRLSAGTGIIYKGTGFYTTDYKKKDEQKCQNSGCNSTSCPASSSN